MTKSEINREISERREPLKTINQRRCSASGNDFNGNLLWTSESGAWWFIGTDQMEWKPKNWHTPENAMVLLKEMPDPLIEKHDSGSSVIEDTKIWRVDTDRDNYNLSRGSTELETAICLAWLKFDDGRKGK